jgi:hypothetical protein
MNLYTNVLIMNNKCTSKESDHLNKLHIFM